MEFRYLGINLGRIVLVISIPGIPSLLRTNWMYRHRHWLGKVAFFQPLEVMVDSMHRIKQVSAQILDEKIADAAALAGDSTLASKKDVMSLLVQSRTHEKASTGGTKMVMSDSMMMEQVVRVFVFASALQFTRFFLSFSSPSWAQGTKRLHLA